MQPVPKHFFVAALSSKLLLLVGDLVAGGASPADSFVSDATAAAGCSNEPTAKRRNLVKFLQFQYSPAFYDVTNASSPGWGAGGGRKPREHDSYIQGDGSALLLYIRH